MCLSNSQDDDSMPMCLSNPHVDDSMPMCLSNSQDDNMPIFAFRCSHSDVSVELNDDDIMLMCLSNSHVDNMPMCLSKLQLILSTVGEQKSRKIAPTT